MLKRFAVPAITLALLALVALPAAASQRCINKDLENLGPDAHDVGVLLSGDHDVTWTYDGYHPPHPLAGHASSVAHGPSGPNTLIRWRDFWDGTDDLIQTGQTIHLGWCTADPHSILDMYWTDEEGNRIAGSVVYNVTTDWTYRTNSLVWTNTFEADALIEVSDVRVAVLPEPLPLADLNRFNDALNDMAEPLADGTFALGPGETMELPVDQPVPAGSAVVVIYNVGGPGSDANALDFMQIETDENPDATDGDADGF